FLNHWCRLFVVGAISFAIRALSGAFSPVVLFILEFFRCWRIMSLVYFSLETLSSL
ncbi:25098_t:CDS:1, partial [Gigaspora rosea]